MNSSDGDPELGNIESIFDTYLLLAHSAASALNNLLDPRVAPMKELLHPYLFGQSSGAYLNMKCF